MYWIYKAFILLKRPSRSLKVIWNGRYLINPISFLISCLEVCTVFCKLCFARGFSVLKVHRVSSLSVKIFTVWTVALSRLLEFYLLNSMLVSQNHERIRNRLCRWRALKVYLILRPVYLSLYASSIFWKIRTYINVFHFSVRVSSNLEIAYFNRWTY